MNLSSDLISQFVKATNDNTKEKTETTVYGKIVESNGRKYVQIDGSDQLTPVTSTANSHAGERVAVMIKNHTATVIGNFSSPAARVDDLQDTEALANQVSEFGIIIANKVDTEMLVAESARIDELYAEDVVIRGALRVAEADIDNLQTNSLEVRDKLTATEADIDNLQTSKLDANIASITYATITDLDATNAYIYNLEGTYGEFADLSADKFKAIEATIDSLETNYANIDFTNIGSATMAYFYAQSGLIKNVVVGNQSITGELVGVTISGDRILGNTVVADKLVIKGSDGLYYKLNTDGMKVEAQQTDENSINGQVIKAKSITATKISVNDLVAFDATIGGFNITDKSIYSGVKETVGNTTRGIYLDKDGQIAIGDSSNYLKYYKDTDGSYKLAISAKSISISGGSDMETAIKNIQNGIDVIEIGGRNLIRGTQNLKGFYANAATPATVYATGADGYTYADFPSSTSVSYRAISSTFSMLDPKDVRNRQVVLSWEMRSDTPWSSTTNQLIASFCMCGSNNTDRLKYRSVYVTGNIGTEWTRFTVKATLTDDFFTSGTGSFDACSRFYIQLYNYSTNHLQIRKPKLEYGNKATDWSPAPEDLYAAVDDVEVGGRNLLRHTEHMPIVATHTSSAGIGLYSSSVGVLTDTGEGLKLTYDASGNGAMAVPLAYDGVIGNGETVTLSFKYRGNITRSCQHYLLQRTNPNLSFSSFPAYQASATEWLEYKHTFSHADANARVCYSLLLAYNPGTNYANGWFEIKKGSLKLERGNKATDWVPAKEDVATDINNASKTATNFIQYDSTNGLQLGNKASGSWTGYRTQITSAAFRILNSSGTVLASYGEKLVELGRNATDAIIKLCSGKGQIEYTADEDSGESFLQMTASKLRLKSSEKSSLYSVYTNNSTRWEKSAVNVTPTEVNMYASECIDPGAPDKVESWTQSELNMDGTSISGTAKNVTLEAQSKTTVKTTNGSIELLPNSRVYSSRQILISNEAKTKHNDGIKGWYFGTDGTAHATHATGGPIIAFHFAGSTDNTSTIAESAAGEIKINGMRFGVNKVLWSGALFMNSGHTASLSEAISKQTNGIVLVWSYYQDGAAKDHSISTDFISKYEVSVLAGCPRTCFMAINSGLSSFGAKYVYVNDTSITGHATNVSSGTAQSGITFSNGNYVLRYVIGV